MSEIQISLAAARVNAGLTQQDVAEKMHISKQTIINWEKGKTEPSVVQADQLAELYNFPRDAIFFNSKTYLK